MKHYKVKEKLITQKTKNLVKLTCDRCNKEISISNGPYETREFTLEFTEGLSYPGPSGSEDGFSIEDLCNSCIGHLKTLLVLNGYTIKKVSRDW